MLSEFMQKIFQKKLGKCLVVSKIVYTFANANEKQTPSVIYVANGFSTDRQHINIENYVFQQVSAKYLKAACVYFNLSLPRNYTFLAQLKEYMYIRSLAY